MWNKPTEKQLAKIPALYSTDGVKFADKKIYMHFFVGGSDWYVAEYDPIDRLFFGYAILNGDTEMAEWGYVSLDELIEVRQQRIYHVDREIHWKVKKASEIEKIRC
jgi:hypothetical protein